jgi:hypothetical protein
MPQPTIVHTPPKYQRTVSGLPISQKTHHRAIWPLISLLRKVMGSIGFNQVIGASNVASDEELSADGIGPQFLPLLVAFGALLKQI